MKAKTSPSRYFEDNASKALHSSVPLTLIFVSGTQNAMKAKMCPSRNFDIKSSKELHSLFPLAQIFVAGTQHPMKAKTRQF